MPPPWRDRRQAAALLALFSAEFVRHGLLLAYLPFSVPAGASPPGMAVGAHFAAETAAKLLAGRAVDHAGPRRSLWTSLIVALILIVSLLAGPGAGRWSGGLPWITGLYGLAMAPVWLAVLPVVAPPGLSAGSHFGAVWLAWLGGAGLGPVLTGLLLGLAPRRTPALLVALALVSLAASAWVPREVPGAVARRGRAPVGAGDDAPRRSGAAIAGAGRLVAESIGLLGSHARRLAALLGPMLLQTFLAGSLLPVLPVFARVELGLSPAQYSGLLVAGGLACVALLLPAGVLADRFGRRPFLVLGFAFAGGFLGLLALGPRGWLLLGTVTGIGVGYALLLPAWTAILGRSMEPGAAATGWGLVATVEGLGLALGPVAGTWAWQRLGPVAPILVAAAILLGLAVFYARAPLPAGR